MEEISMSAKPRTELGKCPSRRLRRSGYVPAILYGGKITEPLTLSLESKRLEKVLHTGAGENVILNLSLEGEGNARKVMFKEITRHPLKEMIQHVDLLEVAMDQTIHVEVPIHLEGKAKGVALGGILQHETRKVAVECLPGSIPDVINVDVTELEVGHALHVSDLQLPEGVKVLDDPELTVVLIAAPVVEEEKTAEEAEEELAKSFEEGEKEEAGEEESGEEG